MVPAISDQCGLGCGFWPTLAQKSETSESDLGLPEMFSTLDLINQIHEASSRNRDRVRAEVFKPTGTKTLEMTFGLTEAAALVNRTPAGLKKAEAEGRLPPPMTKPNGRRYYTLDHLRTIRETLGSAPYRAPSDPAMVIAIQNFKGGVGKSTTTKHLADYLGLRGYRVLVIDCDSQASTTSMFDISPDYDLEPKRSIAGFLSARMGVTSLQQVTHDTVWPTVKIVPANLDLQNVEYEMTAQSRQGGDSFLQAISELRRGIEQVQAEYDVILLDPPPAMGFLALNAMVAANALIVPVPARHMDFCSTIHFFEMMGSIIETLGQRGLQVDYRFLRVVGSSYSPDRAGEKDMWALMRSSYAGTLIEHPIFYSEEIKHAAAELRSIYELDRAVGAQRTHERCRANLDAVFGEIETIIRKQWPSHSRSLEKLGVSLEVAA